MKPFSFLDQVEAEIAEALDWYELRSHRAADGLVEALDDSLDRIAQFPKAFPVIATARDRDIRRALLGRYPYGVVFAELDDVIAIVAFVHLKRRPLYWIERLGQVT